MLRKKEPTKLKIRANLLQGKSEFWKKYKIINRCRLFTAKTVFNEANMTRTRNNCETQMTSARILNEPGIRMSGKWIVTVLSLAPIPPMFSIFLEMRLFWSKNRRSKKRESAPWLSFWKTIFSFFLKPTIKEDLSRKLIKSSLFKMMLLLLLQFLLLLLMLQMINTGTD